MIADLATIRRLIRGQPRAGDLAERLDAFYRPQAAHYDRFRDAMLHGREELVTALAVPPGGTLVELGGGTGRNIEFLGPRLAGLAQVTIVDLCPALLTQARERCRRLAWTNVACVEADACRWRPERPVDAVLLSYCLTMIPDWFLAVDNALSMLRPGGVIGVIDFHVARRVPAAGHASHGALTRWFWPWWFAHSGVHPSTDHLPYLLSRVRPQRVVEARGRVPWMLGLKAPYFSLVGTKDG